MNKAGMESSKQQEAVLMHPPSAPVYPSLPPDYSSVVANPLVPQQPNTPQQQPVTIQQQVQHVFVPQTPVGRNSTSVTCPSCHSTILTKVKTEPILAAHIAAGVLCLLCWLPCVCIPYCIASCKNSIHYCPNCSAVIGTYRA